MYSEADWICYPKAILSDNQGVEVPQTSGAYIFGLSDAAFQRKVLRISSQGGLWR